MLIDYIDYETKNISVLKYMWKDFCSSDRYYKVKNNTTTELTLYRVVKSKLISQDFEKMKKKLDKSNKEIIKLDTKATFRQSIKKIILKPNEKIKLSCDRLPLYWVNEEGNLSSVHNVKCFAKVIFNKYEDYAENVEKEKVIVEEKKVIVKLETIVEEEEEIVEEIKEETDYEKDMNKIKNNQNTIDELLKNLLK